MTNDKNNAATAPPTEAVSEAMGNAPMGRAQDLVINPKLIAAMPPKFQMSFTPDELAKSTGTALLTEEEVFEKMKQSKDLAVPGAQVEKPRSEGTFERSLKAIVRQENEFAAAQPAHQARLAELQKIIDRGNFIKPVRATENANKSKMPRMLLAAAGAGLFASLMLTAQMTKNQTPVPQPTLQVASPAATAQLIKRCNLNLPSIQLGSVSNSLHEWAPMWLATSAALPVEDQNEVCTQLLSASLQGPSQGDAGDAAAFQEGLDDTKQLMLEQIASQVVDNDKVAEDVAPLMGLTPSDVQHYFKSVNKGAPLENSGPTPEDGPHFSV